MRGLGQGHCSRLTWENAGVIPFGFMCCQLGRQHLPLIYAADAFKKIAKGIPDAAVALASFTTHEASNHCSWRSHCVAPTAVNHWQNSSHSVVWHQRSHCSCGVGMAGLWITWWWEFYYFTNLLFHQSHVYMALNSNTHLLSESSHPFLLIHEISSYWLCIYLEEHEEFLFWSTED